MYTFLALAFIGLVCGAILARRKALKPARVYHAGFIGLVIGAVIGNISAMVVGAYMPRHQVIYGPATLVAMHSVDGVSGTFVYGSGSMSSQLSYHFIRRNSDGSLTPGHVPADSMVHIVEDANLKGVGYWTSTFDEADKTSPLAAWALGAREYDVLIRQEFRVPAGTVVQDFVVK